MIACEGAVVKWAKVMVTRWACAVNGGGHVIVNVVINDCRSVTVGANVMDIVFVRRRRRLHFLGVPNDDGFVDVNQWGKYWRSRKNAWCWWRERHNFAETEGVEGLDGFHFVRRCFLDSSNGSDES